MLDQWFAVHQAMQLFGIAGELGVADFLLDGIQRLDMLQRLGGAVGFGGQGLEEASPRMRPTLGMGDTESSRRMLAYAA